MAIYKSRPIHIEAVPVRDVLQAIAQPRMADVPEWVRAAIDKDELIALHAPERLEVLTLEGRMTGLIDDMLIKGTADELYPCKSVIFERKYEFVRG